MSATWVGLAICVLGIFAIVRTVSPSGNRGKVRSQLTKLAEQHGLKNDLVHAFGGTGILIDRDKKAIAIVASTNQARSEKDFVHRIVELKDFTKVAWRDTTPGMGELTFSMNDFNVPSVFIIGYSTAMKDIYEKLCVLWSL